MSNNAVAVNPSTGELLEHLDQQPPEALAAALDAVHVLQGRLKESGDALEAELRRRLKMRQARLVVFGDWEVEASVSRESVWDAVELEGAMTRLVEDGTIRAADIADVITREPVVARTKAKQLASRLTGDARAAIDAACTWKEKPGKLTVARSVNLLDAAPEAAEKTPPVDGKADRGGTVSEADPVLAGSSESRPGAARAPSDNAHMAGPAQPDPPALDPQELFA